MSEFKKASFLSLEILLSLALGLLFTIYVLKYIYENSGFSLSGNVWVNWFGISYFIFFLYSLAIGLSKGGSIFKKRISSTFFWILFLGSIYIVFIPLFIDKNPF
ncbi:hypothetical protein [Bacillus sp. 1P06AnD]|uniref:hypothetical protein n=1 Tax=Bacillus sp. 1P06AnD TaxID=3132208 RepID=UPI0039A1D937